MGIQPKGTEEGIPRPSNPQHLALIPAALDLTPEFSGQLSSDLEGRTAFACLQLRVPTTGGNRPTLCPPGWVVKVNELVFVKCFEIRG